MSVTATLVVDFRDPTESGAGILKAEIDAREDGLNGGKTSFLHGDPVHYLVHRTPNVAIHTHTSSSGNIAAVGNGTRTVEEIVTFANSREARLSYPLSGSLATEWLGRSGGGLTGTLGSEVVRLGAVAVAVARLTYETDYEAFRLSGVAPGADTVLVYIGGTY